MLMEEVNKWKSRTSQIGCEVDESEMEMFFQETKSDYDLWQAVSYLSLQIYQLQVCMEGLLEDMEFLNGQKNKEVKEKN